VRNAATGEPVRRASIVMMRLDPTPGESGMPASYSTSSDANGQFSMKDLDPGRYRLTANRNGYVTLIYGARGFNKPGTMISLSRQQNLTDLALKMTPQSVITGRILDDEGEPVANVHVTLQGYRYMQGRKQLMATGGGNNTNDLGEYRVFGISPGKYIVSATLQANEPMISIDRSADAGPEEGFVATYYPGTTDPAAATQIDVAAGAQLRGIDLVLSKSRTVHVKGHVTHGLSGRPNATVFIVPRNSGGFGGMVRNSHVDPAGNFDIRGVSPGAYTLTAVVNDGNTPRQGRVPVEVGTANVDGVNITAGTGVTVKGVIRADSDSSTIDLSNVRVTLQQREPGMMFGGPGETRDEHGGFELKNASPDHYNFYVYGLPQGAYVKSVRAGQTDVLASGLDLTSGAAPESIDVVISPRGASVTGTVQNEKTGNPAPGAMVVLLPQEKERREQQTYFKLINADQTGAFSLSGIAPGEYRLYAWEDVEPGAYLDPDFLKPIESKGESLTVGEGDQKTIQLKLIPADSSGAAN
jgi:hypothetical protein